MARARAGDKRRINRLSAGNHKFAGIIKIYWNRFALEYKLPEIAFSITRAARGSSHSNRYFPEALTKIQFRPKVPVNCRFKAFVNIFHTRFITHCNLIKKLCQQRRRSRGCQQFANHLTARIKKPLILRRYLRHSKVSHFTAGWS